jgi:hypothetical protein
MDAQMVMYMLFSELFGIPPCTIFMEVKSSVNDLTGRTSTNLQVVCHNFVDSYPPSVKNCHIVNTCSTIFGKFHCSCTWSSMNFSVTPSDH